MSWIRTKNDARDQFWNGTHFAVIENTETGETRNLQISVANLAALCPFCKRPHAAVTSGEIDVEADVAATVNEWNALETRLAAHRSKYAFHASGKKLVAMKDGGKQQ